MDIHSFGLGRCKPCSYSFFNMFSGKPWIVGFSSNTLKDSVGNIAETKEFVYNLATRSLIDEVNRSAVPAPPEIDELVFVGMDPASSRIVKPRRVAASPWAFECKWTETMRFKGLSGKPSDWYLVLGEVVGVHIDDAVIVDGVVDIVKMQSLARCGYMDYTPGKRSDVPEQARLAVTRGAANRREAVSGCLQMYNRRRSNMTDTGSSH